MDNQEVIKKLSEKLSSDAIQRTKGTETKKGYDTTGYGYQSAVDKLNEILGTEWDFDWHIIHESQGTYKSGAPYHDITVEVSISILKQKSRSCVGGHTAMNYADALKGAITNGFKKTAAFWGVGRDAFAGTIDDDNQPLPDSETNKVKDMFNGIEVNDNIEKLKALPEKTKEGLRLLTKNNSKKAIELAMMYEFNIEKIDAHLQQVLK